MDTTTLLLAVVLVLLLWWWLRVRQQRAGAQPPSTARYARSSRADGVDTVAGWPPEATRLLTYPERRAFALLSNALPDYMVLAQVPISRFVRVPTRNSYSEWMRRVGQLCADMVICDKGSQVIAVVELRRPPNRDGDRTRRRHARMDRVLRKAGIRVIEWNEEALPAPDDVREQVFPAPRETPPLSSAPLTPRPPELPPLPVPAAMATPLGPRRPGIAAGLAASATAFADTAAGSKPTLDEVLEEIERRAPAGDHTLPEPTPSTWFDEFDSGPTPLHPQAKDDDER